MSSIFDKIRSFSFLSEAAPPPPPPPSPANDIMLIRIMPDDYNAVARELKTLGALQVVPYPDSSAALYRNTYFTIADDETSRNDIKAYVNREAAKPSRIARMMPVTAAIESVFNSYYDKVLEKELAEITEIINDPAVTPPEIAGSAKAMEQWRRKQAVYMNSVSKERNEAVRKSKQEAVKKQKMQESINKETIAEQSNKQLQKVRRLLKTIDYSDKDLAMLRVSMALESVNFMREHGTLTEKLEREIFNKVLEIQRKLGLPDGAFRTGIENGASEVLIYGVNKFVYGDQKTEQQVADEYGALKANLEAQRKQIKPEVYEKIKTLMDEAMITKITVLKGMKEYPQYTVDTGEKPTGAVEISATDSGTKNEYEMEVRLPLGKAVTISDVEKYKVQKGKKTKEQEEATLLRSMVGRSEVTMFNVLGYEPKGVASNVIAAYDPLRQHAGEVLQLASKNTLGLLGSLLGKNGKKMGEGVGKFLKHELIQNPSEINPAVAESELWLRSRFNVFRMMKMEPTVKGTKSEVAAAVKNYDKNVSEQAVAAPAATPGGDMNMPGMITGMGDPIAPTRTTPGSGDNFNPKKKKKEDEELPDEHIKEHVMDFNSFRDALYGNK